MTKHLIFATIFISIIITAFDGYAQRHKAALKPNPIVLTHDKSLTSRSLEANFLVNDRFGIAPMIIQFKDMSAGQPEKWTWAFGDGASDTVKNPLHTYNESGTYTVKLTVVKDGVSATLTRENYIVVSTEGACDTLAFPLPGDYTFYEIIEDGSGYVSGNNSYGDLAKASYFENFDPESMLLGGVFEFAVSKRSLASSALVKFVAWEQDTDMGTPSGVLAETSLPITLIEQEVGFGWPTVVFFDGPPAINSPFFLGLELPQSPGDSLALYTNFDGDSETGNGWEQHNNGNWYAYSNAQFSWGIELDHAIFPLICQTTGISNHYLDEQILIYPVPAKDKLNVMLLDPNLGDVSLALLDISGRIVYEHSHRVSHSAIINVDLLREGVYFLKIEINGLLAFRKVVIGR
jgi:PKD repeat protein